MPDRKESERLFRAHHERMVALATVLLRDAEEAGDAVSDVFARLVDGTLQLPAEKPDSYLLVTVRNLCLDRIRRLSLRERVRRHLTLEIPSLVPVETERQMVGDMMAYAEQTLPPQTWRVFRLRFGDDRSYREIAEELGISEVAVYKHLAQALRRLREQFNPTRQ